ncbi:MAG: NrfD/PsrC family molybdoenzyme membrane anchor subunit [Deltaproteobacteria bacterium]|nr:NrfD/PsrC family molybdoenzyme membrane anchor subunit [Deltaproteobacteria bacterium]
MAEKTEKWYPGEGKLTTGRAILYVILVLGLISAIVRLFFGLGATTNLNDAYPWGLWISFDILSGVALAGGGFTMAATIYIFNLKKFEPLLRPAKLSAFIGYLIFVVGLFFDLGQPWRLWHPMVMWNPHSVLFEVSWCVMLYTTVLGVDIFIMALERWQKYEWVAFLRNIYLVLVVAGVMLSTLHQSSLGALYLLMPEKMSDLWASRAIGPLFFCSAVIGGMSVVTLESLISSWAYNRKPELKLLSSFSRGLGIVLLVYFAMKVTDLYARGATVWVLDKAHFFFFLELFGTVALPAILLSFAEVRNSIKGLYWAAGLAAFGVVLNRFNVSLTSYGGYRDFSYFPSAMEIIITLALIAGGILIFDFGTRYLPLYPSELTGKTS